MKFNLKIHHILIIILVLLLLCIIYTNSNTCDNFYVSALTNPRLEWDDDVLTQFECKLKSDKFYKKDESVLVQLTKGNPTDPECMNASPLERTKRCTLGDNYRILKKIKGTQSAGNAEYAEIDNDLNMISGKWSDIGFITPYKKKDDDANEASGINITSEEAMIEGKKSDINLRCPRFELRRGHWIGPNPKELYNNVNNISKFVGFGDLSETDFASMENYNNAEYNDKEARGFLLSIANGGKKAKNFFKTLHFFNRMICDNEGSRLKELYSGSVVPIPWLIDYPECYNSINKALESKSNTRIKIANLLKNVKADSSCIQKIKERSKYEAIRLIFSAKNMINNLNRMLGFGLCINPVEIFISRVPVLKDIYESIKKNIENIKKGLDAVLTNIGPDLRPLLNDEGEPIDQSKKSQVAGTSAMHILNKWSDACDVNVLKNGVEREDIHPCRNWTGYICGDEVYGLPVFDNNKMIHNQGEKKEASGCDKYYFGYDVASIYDDWFNPYDNIKKTMEELTKARNKWKRHLEEVGLLPRGEWMKRTEQELKNAYDRQLQEDDWALYGGAVPDSTGTSD